MEERRGNLGWAAVLALLVAGTALAQEPDAAAPSPRELEAQIGSGQAEQAYAALVPLKSRYAGQLWYEALLGRAAIKSGHLEEGIAILTRLLDQHPEHDPSRFYLALGQAQVGNKAAAREQYQWLAENASTSAGRQQARDAIQTLDGASPSRTVAPATPAEVAAEKRKREAGQNWAASLFVATGYDTNANSSSQEDRFLIFRLDEADVQSRTPFVSAGGDFTHVTLRSDPWSWRNGVNYGHRLNTSAHEFDLDVGGVRSTVQWKGDHSLVATGLGYDTSYVSGSYHDSTTSWLTRYERLTYAALLGAAVQYALVRYQDAFRIQDVDSWLLELSAATPDDDARWQFSVLPVVGVEEAREPDSPFGRTLYGLRGNVTWHWREGLDLRANAGGLFSSYEIGNSGTPARHDQRYSGGAVASWQPQSHKGWAVSGGLSYVRNDSNTAGFAYDRLLASLQLTRSWGGATD